MNKRPSRMTTVGAMALRGRLPAATRLATGRPSLSFGCSEKSVKNYISEIYARFGLLQMEYPKRKTRFARLRALAQEAGFV